MRISDWSSDVCSSDLRGRPVIVLDAAEVRKAHRLDALVEALRAQAQPRIAAGTVLFLDVPLAFLAPAEADRAIWNRQFAAGLVVSQRLPFRVVGFAQAAEVTGAQEAFRHQAAIRALFQAHQQRHVRSEEHTSELQSLMRISYA